MSDDENRLIRREEVGGELTIGQLAGNMEKLREVMKSVMKKDQDYGEIPGTNSKPTLLKPGGEKLAMLFRYAPQYEETIIELPGNHREYRTKCRLVHIPTGNFVGEASGVCTTAESKYKWRGGARKCPSCGKSTIKKSKFPPRDAPDMPPGFYCHAKVGGCGAEFSHNDPEITSQSEVKTENPDIADSYNTVQQISQKRAFLAAIKTATASSELFTTEVADPDNMPHGESPHEGHGEPPPSSTPPSEPPPKAWVPSCKLCNAPMRKQKRKSDGQEFWSCTKWRETGCKGTMSLEQAEAEKPGNAPSQVSRDFEQLRDNLYNMGVPKGNLPHADAIVAYAVDGTTLKMCATDAALANKVLDALIGFNAVGDTTEEIYFKALTAAGIEIPAELQAKVDAILAGS